MHITDLNGCRIKVTDLDKALRITAQYKNYRHENKIFAMLDKKLNAYWTDMHTKLTALKKTSE